MLTIVLASLAMIGPFTIDTIFPGFEQIGADFSADTAALQQVTSIYLLSFAVMSVLHGPLSDALGRKPVMIGGLAGYTLASILCAFAPNLTVLLIGRAIQGLFAGAATIVSRAVIRDLFEGAQAQRLMSQVAMIFAIAPAIAPVIGGFLLQLGPWPGIFWFVAGYAVATAVLVAVVLPETLPAPDRQPLAIGSIFGSLLLVARSFAFERLAIATAFIFAGYFLYIVAAPIIVLDLLGLGEQDFWMLFVPMIGGMVTGSLLTNRLAGRIDAARLVDLTMIFMLAVGATNVALAAWSPGLPWVLIGPGLMGVTIGVAFPLLNLALLDMFPQHRGAAASLGSFASLCFNALLAGVISPLVVTSLFSTALSSAALALTGAGLWAWHRVATRPPGSVHPG